VVGEDESMTDDTKESPTDERPCDERFETVLNSISDGVFAVDAEWRITCFNAAAERTLRLDRDDAIGRPCHEVFRSDICKEACALRYTMETGKPVVNLLIHIRDAHDSRVPVTISTALLKDQRGRVIGGVETFRDLNLVKQLIGEADAHSSREEIITADPRVKKLLEIVPTIARSDSTVLIEGESGTGKGLLARTVHRASARSDGPMVTISCGALPESLLESELFGYKAGAFTGAETDKPGRVEIASGGTLFLDEIGDLPLPIQAKLLRLLQERLYEPLGDVRSRKADVRVVAATNRNLTRMVEENAFRSDLYYRVNVIRLQMPPLRERTVDIPLLVDAFLRRMSMTRGKVVEGLVRSAMRRLMRYDYPGNVRELENILEHAYVLCDGKRIEERDLPAWLLANETATASAGAATLEEMEARFLRDVLARNGWNRQEAARELGIHKTTLHRKIRRLGIELPPIDGRAARRKTSFGS
jgi:PAS domain S-box-containing protein